MPWMRLQVLMNATAAVAATPASTAATSKRAKAVEAAESRRKNFWQGGNAALAELGRKNMLLGKIETIYNVRDNIRRLDCAPSGVFP